MDQSIEHVLIAFIVACPQLVASLTAVAIAYMAYRQGIANGEQLKKVERNTDGLADKAIQAAKDGGRAEGIKEEILRKSVVPPTTPGFP